MTSDKFAHPFPVCICVACGPPWRNENQQPNKDEDYFGWLSWFSYMSLCPKCGNKRCRGAVNHELGCDLDDV